MVVKKPSLKAILVVFYIVFFAVYFYIGFQPVAEARSYSKDNYLEIPSIGLNTATTNLTINSGKLETPTNTVGSYSNSSNKTLLFGHAAGVFKNLSQAKVGEVVKYAGENYQIKSIETIPKENINMSRLLNNTKRKVLKIMTCAGDFYGEGDATHRLIITAVKEEAWKSPNSSS